MSDSDRFHPEYTKKFHIYTGPADEQFQACAIFSGNGLDAFPTALLRLPRVQHLPETSHCCTIAVAIVTAIALRPLSYILSPAMPDQAIRH